MQFNHVKGISAAHVNTSMSVKLPSQVQVPTYMVPALIGSIVPSP